MATFLSTFTISAYLVSGVWITVLFMHQSIGTQRSPWLPLLPALLATISHSILLSIWSFDAQQIDLGFFNVLSLVSWVAATMVLLFNIKKPAMSLGIIIFPFSALSVLLHSIGLDKGHMMNVDVEVKTHILLSILAFSLLVIASVQAVLFAMQEKQLRNHHANGFIRRLPPMETMETFLFQLIRWGFIALTLSIFNGLLFLEDMFQQHMVHKSILSVVAWFVFATLLWGRRQFGWRGRVAIRWTLAGFITLLLAYFGSKMVLELILPSA